MIAVDTSVWVSFSRGVESDAIEKFELALDETRVVMPHPVLFEILSGPGLTTQAQKLILELPRLEILEGYWERAGSLRQALLKSGLKARGMDCLIAQSCIDHNVPLLTTDTDFRHFLKQGLKLDE